MITLTSFGRNDGLEVDAEAVGKEKRLPFGEIWPDVLAVGGGLLGVGDSDHDHVGEFHGLGRVVNRKAIVFGDFAALAAGIEADDDFAAAVL